GRRAAHPRLEVDDVAAKERHVHARASVDRRERPSALVLVEGARAPPPEEEVVATRPADLAPRTRVARERRDALEVHLHRAGAAEEADAAHLPALDDGVVHARVEPEHRPEPGVDLGGGGDGEVDRGGILGLLVLDRAEEADALERTEAQLERLADEQL